MGAHPFVMLCLDFLWVILFRMKGIKIPSVMVKHFYLFMLELLKKDLKAIN